MPDANAAALDYDVEVHSFFTPGMRADALPRFDAILLGMGPDGHTASLFPGSKALEEKERWVVANWVEKFNSARITFTFPVINAASNVHRRHVGERRSKADMFAKSSFPSRIEKYPSAEGQACERREGLDAGSCRRRTACRGCCNAAQPAIGDRGEWSMLKDERDRKREPVLHAGHGPRGR